MKKQKLNKFKVALALITIPELVILFTTSKEALNSNINLWRLYCLILMCVMFNMAYIFTKRTIKR